MEQEVFEVIADKVFADLIERIKGHIFVDVKGQCMTVVILNGEFCWRCDFDDMYRAMLYGFKTDKFVNHVVKAYRRDIMKHYIY